MKSTQPHYQNILDLERLIDSTLEYLSRHPEEHTSCLITLINIEDILDKARSDIFISARDQGLNEDETRRLVSQANTIMDALRGSIREIVQAGEYDDILRARAENAKLDWRKWTPEELAKANAQPMLDTRI